MSSPATWLRVSGFGGIVAGMLIGLYQVVLRDPMLLGGEQAAPDWLVAAHVHFFGLSLIVLFFSLFLVDAFDGYERVVAGLAVVGQWGIPLTILVAYLTEIMMLNALQLPLALVNVGVGVAFLVNVARRGDRLRDAPAV